MIELFDIASNDQSVYYLSRIFGRVGTLFSENLFKTEGAPIVLEGMLQVINSIALTVGVLIITYTTVVGLFATAHEGEFLGKKWGGSGGAIWIPIRTVIGIAGLFPSSGGYCAIQIIIMWIVLQGIGAADVLWSTSLSLIKVGGRPGGSGGAQSIGMGTSAKIEKLFQALVCQETAKTVNDNVNQSFTSGITIKYFCKNKPEDAFCTAVTTLSSPADVNAYTYYKPPNSETLFYNMGPVVNKSQGGSCGYVIYADQAVVCAGDKQDSLTCMSAKAQGPFLAKLINPENNSLGTIARQVAQLDTQYVNFTSAPAPDDELPKNIAADYVVGADNKWIQEYCTTTKANGGLGLADVKECCPWTWGKDDKGVLKECAGYTLGFNEKKAVGGTQQTAWDPTNTNDVSVTSIYQPFGLKTLKDVNFIEVAAADYVATVIKAPLDEYIKKQDPAADNGWMADARKLGWLRAGGFYMRIAKEKGMEINGEAPFDVVANDTPDAPIKSYRNNSKTAKTLISYIKSGEQAGTISSFSGAGSEIPGAVSAGKEGEAQLGAVLNGFRQGLIKEGEDPLISISESGLNLMKAAQALFFSYSSLATIAAIIAGYTGGWVVLGTGNASTSAIYHGFSTAWSFLSPLLLLLVSSLFSVGAMLGVYVPLIPYIIFTVTAIGWFIAVIEAMVAAPFIALGIMMPSGQHELMSRAEPSIMIIFNLFLRPALIVMGMIAGMYVANVVVRFINDAFFQVMKDVVGGSGGFLLQIVFMCAYVTLIVTAINKAFSLIFLLPEKILTYVGGHAMGYGEAEMAGQVKHGIEGGGGALGKGMGATAAIGLATKKKNAQQAADEAARLNKNNT